ncbi:adaptin N terminal region-domain-containing protein [Dunaliella salina]|uniref:Adaptin N terminal region-domain-containing protein n=1 Tax=Dunaliella salina TaxID=3046 RepID=A0ABQ7G728_DUNSA|nr:adaptin N terminal region-domain-containing protein [Dunaliella salina]|eukprot:KAF5830402.1 adaptin N terminal region-domain-containing protein [Dunaliella salina]
MPGLVLEQMLSPTLSSHCADCAAHLQVQYVALRNINLIIQKRPSILANEVKVFFCKYNDPIYVKLEKLEIMIKLASEKNIDQVLLEFKEYAQEVDVDFVRKAVRAIGRCAVILERAAEKCINVLLELIQTKVNYVVQEAIIVIKDIFRRYPNQYESIIATLCENLESLDEPEAKASMIWIIGEYAERIDNADELLESFLETFPEETSIVQLQLLTATVKLFLKRPNELAQRVISLVLSCATTETDNPDLRDRAYIYWRLLSTDPEAAKDVVLCEKPVITDDSSNLDPLLLHKLLGQISTLASVYHKLCGYTFEEDSQPQGPGLEHSPSGHAISPSDGGVSAAAPTASTTAAASPAMMGDLLDMSDGIPPAGTAPPGKQAGDVDDLLGGLDIASGAPAAPASAPPPLPILMQDPSRGVTIGGQLERHAGGLAYHISIVNSGAVPLSGFMIQTNKNSFGIAPANQVLDLGVVPPGGSSHTHCPLTYDAAKLVPGPANAELQVAIKTDQVGVLFIKDVVRLEGLLEESGAIDGASFLAAWKALPAEKQQRLTGLLVQDLEWAKAKLHTANLFVLAHRPVPSTPQQALYLTGRVAGPGGAQIMLELRLVPGQPGIDASFKSEKADLAQMAFAAVQAVLSVQEICDVGVTV